MSGRARLTDAFERYGAVIAAQIEALEAGEFEALENLADERDALAAAIEREAATGAGDDAGLRAILERCHAADVRLRAKIATLRAGALDAVHRSARDATAARSYAGSAPQGAKLDIEL